LIAGCGGDGEDDGVPTFSGTDEEQIAGTVNAMTGAIAAGDGELACGLMTELGQQRMVRIGRQVGGEEVTTCTAAVPAVEATGFDPGDFRVTPNDVSLDEENLDQGQANCDLRGAFLVVRTEVGWRVSAPACID
jgi:hypothetical protein